MKKLLALAVALILLGPSAALIGVGVLMNPAATAACLPGSLIVGEVPDSLTATTRVGEMVTLNKTQLTHAATIITVGARTAGVGRPGVVIALMAALTESTLRMLANTSAYPESANYPNDGDGGDHDSLGLFQMRPASGWGTVAELMDPTYQARAFYGGQTGPNYPSPRGLLDIPGWQQLDPGAAAQAVEVSAYPDRYQNYQPVAEAILAALTRPVTSGGYGNLIVIEHTVAGQRVASYYGHMWDTGIYVSAGETVTAGQHIGDVGSNGKSTGPHLHLEIHPGGYGADPVDADAWLTDHGAEGITPSDAAPAACTAGGA